MVLQWAWDKGLIQGHEDNLTEPIQIVHPGTWNTSKPGPDFNHAILKINGLTWHGSVEIHFKASDWWKHRHHLDSAYHNVVLHVVVENDKPLHIHGERISTLVIAPKVVSYLNLLKNTTHNPLPCATYRLPFTEETIYQYWVRRIRRKFKGHGIEVQNAAFVLGEYPLVEDHLLHPRQRHKSHFFNSLYIAKKIIAQNPLCQLEKHNVNRIASILTQSGMTRFEKNHLLINGFIPFFLNNLPLTEIAKQCASLPAEKNKIIHFFEKQGIMAKNALQSQGLMEIYRQLCARKQCLQCEIGHKILSS